MAQSFATPIIKVCKLNFINRECPIIKKIPKFKPSKVWKALVNIIVAAWKSPTFSSKFCHSTTSEDKWSFYSNLLQSSYFATSKYLKTAQ